MRSRLSAMIRKELIQVVRDPRALAMDLLIPIAWLPAFGYAVTFAVKHVATGVVDQAHTTASAELIADMRESPNFSITTVHAADASGLCEAIKRGQISAGLLIPGSYGAIAGTTPVTVFLDGSALFVGKSVEAAAQTLFQRATPRQIRQGTAALGITLPIAVSAPHFDILYNPNMTSSYVMIPGLIGTVMGYICYGELTVKENLAFYGMYGLCGTHLRVRCGEVVAQLGLQGQEQRRAAALSGGLRQRLALGCALIHRPPVLLLDEPTGGMDPMSRHEFWDLMYELAGDGTTLLVTTHHMDEAEYCDRLALLHGGILIGMGTPAALKDAVPGIVLEVRATPLTATLRAPAPWKPMISGTALRILVTDSSGIARLRTAPAIAGIDLGAVTPVAPTLEDVFLSLVQDRPTI